MSMNYEFFSQAKIISGNKALEHIPVELGSFDAVKPLVITGTKAAEKGWNKTFIKAMYDSTVTIGAIFDGVPEYSSIAMARELAGLFRHRGCDSIVAMGSGAVADCAKIVNVLVSEKTDDPLPFTAGRPLAAGLKPLVFVAAGPSAGNETTDRAAVDNRVIISPLMYPDIVVLDPRLARGCCAECVVSSGMTALTQAVESLMPENANPMNDSYAGAAIQFLSENLNAGVKKLSDKKAGLALANASAMAGIAFSNAAPGMAFCLASAIAKETGLDAGILMGILLPCVMEYRLQKKLPISDELLLWLAGMDTYSATPANNRAQAAVRWIRNFKESFGELVPPSIEKLRVPMYRLEPTVDAAVKLSGGKVKAAEFTSLLQRAFEGSVSH